MDPPQPIDPTRRPGKMSGTGRARSGPRAALAEVGIVNRPRHPRPILARPAGPSPGPGHPWRDRIVFGMMPLAGLVLTLAVGMGAFLSGQPGQPKADARKIGPLRIYNQA